MSKSKNNKGNKRDYSSNRKDQERRAGSQSMQSNASNKSMAVETTNVSTSAEPLKPKVSEGESYHDFEKPIKPQRGFIEGLMGKFGYVRTEMVYAYFSKIYDLLGNDMDEDSFASLSLVEKFKSIVERIKDLKAVKQESETEVVVEVTVNPPFTVVEEDSIDLHKEDEKDSNVEDESIIIDEGSKDATDNGLEITDLTNTNNDVLSECIEETNQTAVVSANGNDVPNAESGLKQDLEGKENTIIADNNKCQELKEQVDKLTKENEELAGLKMSNESLKNTVSELNGKLKQLQDDNDLLLGKQKDYDAKIKELNEKRTQNDRLTNENNTLKNSEDNLRNENKILKDEKRDLDTKFNKLDGDHKQLQDEYDQCKKRLEELEGGDVAKLKQDLSDKEGELKFLKDDIDKVKEELNTVKTAKDGVDSQLETANKKLEEANKQNEKKESELQAEKKKVIECNKTIEDKEKEIADLQKKSQNDDSKIAKQTEDIKERDNTINAKQSEINQLGKEKDKLQDTITGLNKNVVDLKRDNENLNTAKEQAEQLTKDKVNFICRERDEYATSMINMAESLSEVSAKDFLGCCDDAFEDNRVSLQEKVLKPIRAFVRDLKEVDLNDYQSREEVEEAYHGIVKANLDSMSGLTRIAQWYAYSCVSFMVDEERADGMFVKSAEIKEMYSLATKLLGMVGVEYVLPALFAERMADDNIYENVTGRRQLNIEYMCPTVRNHKERIDCIDNTSVIIDVVEVGYRDNRGNSKHPQVII